MTLTVIIVLLAAFVVFAIVISNRSRQTNMRSEMLPNSEVSEPEFMQTWSVDGRRTRLG